MKLLQTVLASTMLVLTFASPAGHIHFPHHQAKEYADSFSRTITDLVRNLTALDHLYKEYNQHSYIKIVNKKELRDNIANEIEKLLQSKVENIERLVKKAEDVYENYTFDAELDYDFLNSKKLLSTADMAGNQIYTELEMSQKIRSLNLTKAGPFNYMPVSDRTSTVQVPTTVFDRSVDIMNGALWTKQLESTFISNYEKNESQTWQYFCSTDGFFRVFPGMKWPRDNEESGIDFFDCRVQNWYLQGASGPKNVVILVDSSGSMKGLRMIIAQSTVKQILNTLDDDDHFNIIRFSDEVKYVDSCFNDTFNLMSATKENKKKLADLIEEDVEAAKQADFGKAIEEVFNLFDRFDNTLGSSYGRLCNKAILLITDGVPELYKTLFETRNWPDKRIRVFTFLIGRDVKDDREIKWMACANKGYYSHISTLADVQENVQNYIKVLSRPMVINRDYNLVWTSVYLDHISSLESKKGLKFLTSVAMPVYDKKNETFKDGNLLGVMGTDVPIQLLKDLAPTYKLGVNAYAFMINHNGFVLFHPDFKPYRTDPEMGASNLNPNYSNMDLEDIIRPANKKAFDDMRRNMLNMAEGSKILEILHHYDSMKRMVKREYAFVYRKIMNQSFVFGLALPTTFNERANVDVLDSPLRETLNGSNNFIAPWPYCRSLDRKLRGKARIDKLIEIYENESLREKDCDEMLLLHLRSDGVFTKNLHKTWKQSALEYRTSGLEYEYELSDENQTGFNDAMGSHGIDLVFFGSKGGLTRYLHIQEGSTPSFLENKTSTVDSTYYKRAVESMERLTSKQEYSFTFSMHNIDGFNINDSTVVITAPIVVKDNVVKDNAQPPMGVAGVVGVQMKYRNFERMYFASNTGFRDVNCSNPFLSCYLVDDHGYIMASKYPMDDNGAFLGDVDALLMRELIRQKLFQRYTFTDKQGVCQVKAGDAGRNSASYLLNPLKLVFRGLIWTITEIALFISEFSFSHLFHRWRLAAGESEMAGDRSFSCDIDISKLEPDERISFRQLSAVVCFSRNKVIGYRPCHLEFSLYMVDFKRLAVSPLNGSIDGCDPFMDCNPDDINCTQDKY